MKVSVVIPSHNRSDALRLTLERLAKQHFDSKWEVIVVNNNSTDDTDEVVHSQSFPCELKLVHRHIPGAVAASRNAGAREATGDYLVFIDNDILVAPTFLQDHVHLLDSNPGCWIVGVVNPLPAQEKLPLGQYRRSLQPKAADLGVHETIGFSGAICSLPRADFTKLGGFDEGFIISSSEDQELALRARSELGVRVLVAPEIVGIHNDWAGWTFRDYCWRQRLYSQTDYYFWSKYGEKHPRIKLVQESLPINLKEDSLATTIRKIGKRILGMRPVQFLLISAASISERARLPRKVLWTTYKLALAGAIDKGLREGRDTFLAQKSDGMAA